MLLTRKSSLLIRLLCVRGGLIDHNISVILRYYTSCVRLAVVCGSDRVVGDSSYCKVMQCVTFCRRSIVQCEHNSNWMLPQIVVQCENKGDPMTLKIMQCELSISLWEPDTLYFWRLRVGCSSWKWWNWRLNGFFTLILHSFAVNMRIFFCFFFFFLWLYWPNEHFTVRWWRLNFKVSSPC